MHAIIANTIWAPLFVYRYDTASALLTYLIGFIAECGVFRLYTRSLLPLAATLRRLVFANLASYVAGHLLLIFVPLDVHKDSLPEIALAFFIAYIITLPVEFYVLRPLLPNNRNLLLRAVTMSNFASYSILFVGYFLWFFNWRYLVGIWTGKA